VLALTLAMAALMVGILTWAPNDDTWGSKIFVAGSLVGALVLGVNVRTRRAYLRSLLERAATLERERDREAQIAVDAERSRIAREMHDVVAHNLSVMIALSQGAEATTRRDPAAAAGVMREVVTVGRQALGEMRRLLGVLRDDGDGTLAPQPGDADLNDLVARVRSAGLAVELVVAGEPNRASPGAQLALHRIVQESLTNVLKHVPGAEKAVVSVQYTAEHIDVEVTNDDYGSHPAAPTHSPGHGLTGMRERAAVYGGVFHAGRTAAGGWRVSARLELAVDA
jgi:signal transduction histidine kinase